MSSEREVSVYWWKRPHGRRNFGDDLNELLLPRLFGVGVAHTSIDRAELIAIGSILQQVPCREHPVWCWGAGQIAASSQVEWDSIRVSALRGRLTLDRAGRLARTPALGDPALLVSRLVDGGTFRKKYRLGVVPHYVDSTSDWVKSVGESAEVVVLDIEHPPDEVLQLIGECEAVVSSSLHGLIVADALGVPNGWVRLSDQVSGQGFKFADYYSTFGIDRQPWSLRPADLLAGDVIRSYRPIANLEAIQERLLDAFPIEAVSRSVARGTDERFSLGNE